ncbi:septum formation initiator family protein [uncultured Tyzzerella sp.]|uniref:FtsB family cell division protein n=1 Tax=uncultured Tyzzerella sp. TaxID=2321398 RepID=UPI0029433420|nr:septum formation initiator family protein [uncultured Tyzzerella sp.]
MNNLEKKKKHLKINKLYFITMISIVFIFSSYLFYKYDTLIKYNKKIEQIKKEIEIANKTNEELKNQTEYKNSNEYIEKIARDKLGMVKNNEIIFYDKN